MKKINQIFSLFVAIIMLTLSLVTGVWAEDVIITDENEVVGILEQTVVEDEIVVGDIIGDDEIIPMAASECTVYVRNSIDVDDFSYPNSTIYYTSNGQASGTVYSIIYTNEFGGTIIRHDIASYNGGTLGHGSVSGPHTHRYRWWVYDGINRYKEESVTPYNG